MHVHRHSTILVQWLWNNQFKRLCSSSFCVPPDPDVHDQLVYQAQMLRWLPELRRLVALLRHGAESRLRRSAPLPFSVPWPQSVASPTARSGTLPVVLTLLSRLLLVDGTALASLRPAVPHHILSVNLSRHRLGDSLFESYMSDV